MNQPVKPGKTYSVDPPGRSCLFSREVVESATCLQDD